MAYEKCEACIGVFYSLKYKKRFSFSTAKTRKPANFLRGGDGIYDCVILQPNVFVSLTASTGNR